MSKIERLRRLHETATPAPWTAEPHLDDSGEYQLVCHVDGDLYPLGTLNYPLAAEARNALPHLLDLADAAHKLKGTGGWGAADHEARQHIFDILTRLEKTP